jgi:hypothetical protein
VAGCLYEPWQGGLTDHFLLMTATPHKGDPEDFRRFPALLDADVYGSIQSLQLAIFAAFDRFDEHLYEFQFGKGPNDPQSRRYVLPHTFDPHKPNVAGNVAETTIAALGLKVDQSFGYWFDFGDDWWHQINVVAIDDAGAKGKYPKVVKRVGKSPLQYADEE